MPALLIVCAVVPGMLLTMARTQRRLLLRAAGVLVVGFVVGVVVPINANRVFAQYPEQYCPRAQNAYDIAQAMKAFLAEEGHTREHAWIVGYPHWVDSRAVGEWIGDINFPNTVMGPEEAAQVDLQGEPGWFVLNFNDKATLQALRAQYPQGVERVYQASQCPDALGKRFVVFVTQPAAMP
jgi:hypothetical protein